MTRLTGELSDANADVTELTGFLNTAQGEVTRLKGEIGVETDAADADGSLHAQLNAANAEVASLTARVGTTSDASSLTGRLETANAEVTRLTGLLNTANAEVTRLTGVVGTATDADSLTGKLEAEKLKVSRLQNQVSIHEDTIAGLRGQLADARTEVTDAEQRAEQAKREADRKVAEAKRQAEQQANVSVRAPKWIDAEALGLAANGDERDATVEYVGSTLTFEPDGGYTSGSAAPSVPGSWHSASFSDPSGAGTETAYLYTNIQKTSAKEFWKIYGAEVARITGKENPKARRTGSLVHDTNETTFSGTYDGAGGTFLCMGGDVASCNAANAANAAQGTGLVVTGTVGSFDFTPNKNQLTRRITQQSDMEYLYFGIWAYEPKDASMTHEFEWIAGGVGTITNFEDLTGTARFTGGAVGKYALKAQTGRAARVGTFTATASFRADFDDDEFEGRITDFREGGTSLSGWSLYLGSDARNPAGITTSSASASVIHGSVGEVAVASGGWAATFHGSDNPTYADFGGEFEPECPATAGCPAADVAGVVGWFDAFDGATVEASNAALAGTFGAVCTTGAMCAR